MKYVGSHTGMSVLRCAREDEGKVRKIAASGEIEHFRVARVYGMMRKCRQDAMRLESRELEKLRNRLGRAYHEAAKDSSQKLQRLDP